MLEDPWEEVPDYVYSRTVNPEDAPDQTRSHHHRFRARRRRRAERRGDVAGDAADRAQRARPQARHRPARPGREPLRRHEVAAACTRRRAAPSIIVAHRGIEQITLDRGARPPQGRAGAALCRADLQRLLVLPPEREMLQAAIDHSQEKVTGTVRLKLYKGSVDRGRPQVAATRSMQREGRDLRGRSAAPMTSATRRASSSSTRCSLRLLGAARRLSRRPGQAAAGACRYCLQRHSDAHLQSVQVQPACSAGPGSA